MKCLNAAMLQLTLALAFSQTLHSLNSPQISIRRTEAHMLVSDCSSACTEATEALRAYPENPDIHECAIKAFAFAGLETMMMQLWNTYSDTFSTKAKDNRQLKEAMAWGVIHKGMESPSPIIRMATMLAAFFGQDAKSVKILSKCLEDRNSELRAIAVKLSSSLRDTPLKNKIIAITKSRDCWKVRKEALRAIGSMCINEGKPLLLSIVHHDHSTQEEKAIASEGLLQMLETIDRPGIEALCYSNRAALRLFAAEAIAYLISKRDVDLLQILACDNHAIVRSAALYALGLVYTDSIPQNAVMQLAISKIQDPSPEVSITATWLLALLKPGLATEPFAFWLASSHQDLRIMAAAALASAGEAAVPLMYRFFQCASDPFVRMNLAIGLIQQQSHVNLASRALYEGFVSDTDLWMWNEDTPFKALCRSDIRNDGDISSDPEAIDQLTRLEILNLLAITKEPMAQEAVKDFLTKRKWGISGLAATLLLSEGDESATTLVHGLLNDCDKRVRLQAALILSLWSREESSISTLEGFYLTADRETKERLLESIGRIGSPSSLPFLIDKLQEPQQLLRIIAAGAILQCLYH